MLKLSLAEIAAALHLEVLGDGAVMVSGLAIDSRQVRPGDLFVAIKGEQTDGHRFVANALASGASAAVVADRSFLPQGQNGLIADDGIAFVQLLAQEIHRRLPVPVIAITGSSGKTTTKDMLANILAQHYPIVATWGNHNNELGLPLTMTEIDETIQAAVLEMGMRGLGQIDFLCRIARPQMGIITNIGTVHSELLGSRENIAKAKAELLTHIPRDGVAVLNSADKPFLAPYVQGCRGQVIWCGLDSDSDVWAEEIVEKEEGAAFVYCDGQERQGIQLALNGAHNVQNALAAIVIARTLAVPWSAIGTGLAQGERSAMRMETVRLAGDILLLNDAYNANPESMAAALTVLAQKKGRRKIAVLGDMYELGQYEAASHREVGEKTVQLGIDILLAVGDLAKGIAEGAQAAAKDERAIYWAADNQAAIARLKAILQPGDVVLLKASRGMKMEEIAEEIMG